MHSRLSVASTVLALSAGLARGLSISSGCQSTLLNVAASDDSACLNVGGLAGVLTTSENSSLVPSLNTWLAGACAQDPCTNDTLSAVITNITSGCSTDLSSIGFSNDSTSDVIAAVQEAYPTVRQIACLKQTTNDTLCATSLLTQVEDSTGETLSIDNIPSLLSSVVTGDATDLPDYIKCSDCVKEAYNVLKEDQSDIASSSNVTDALTSQCGSSFIDGSEVSAIAEGTGSAVPTASGSTSGAADLMTRGTITGIAFSALAAVSSAFLVLA